MVRYLLKEKIADMEFAEDRRITIEEISTKTGISRPTLTRILGKNGYSTSTDVLGKLCEFFKCDICDLVRYIKE